SDVIVAAMLIHQLPKSFALAARSANIWREDDVTIADKELNEWIPADRVLSIERVAKHQQGRLPGLRFRTVRFIYETLHFRTVETSIRRDVRPYESRFAPQVRGHRIRELSGPPRAWRRDPEIRCSGRIGMREGDAFSIRRPFVRS